jgi:SAM-dependent methyltransferase
MGHKIFDKTSYNNSRILHWDDIYRSRKTFSGGRYYHRRLETVFGLVVTPGQRVLEIGCGDGRLLASLSPAYGLGIDFSGEALARAKAMHPQLRFLEADAHDLKDVEGLFDIIVLSDLLNDLWDVQLALEQLPRLCSPSTRIIVNVYSHLWQQPLRAAQRMKLATPTLLQNWLTIDDVTGLLALTNFGIVRHWEEVLWPLGTPLLAPLFNRYLVKLWPFRYLALSHMIVARPRTAYRAEKGPLVSVIVAARNEAGNIAEIMRRVPEMGAGTEIVFVEGHSKDNTFETIQRAIAVHPERRCKLFRQTGGGKGDAVRLGFAEASGDILMILDADLTVPPEDLPRFYHALQSGHGEFINGVRLVYPMQEQAMRFFNLIGNKFFSLVFSWLLGQPIKDTLCGTKVIRKKDYELLVAKRSYFGDFDPFGDFDLIFGAARLNLKIIDLPIRYRARTHGETNIQRWKHGVLLLRMVIFAARRIKFV